MHHYILDAMQRSILLSEALNNRGVLLAVMDSVMIVEVANFMIGACISDLSG